MKMETIKIPKDRELWEHIEIEIQCGYYNTMTLQELFDKYMECSYLKHSVVMLSGVLDDTLNKLKEIKKNEQETKIQDR